MVLAAAGQLLELQILVAAVVEALEITVEALLDLLQMAALGLFLFATQLLLSQTVTTQLQAVGLHPFLQWELTYTLFTGSRTLVHRTL
jgi:hypothetical protein